MHVRPARGDDYEPICALLSAVDARHHAALPERFNPTSAPARPRDWLDAKLSAPDAALLLAEEEGAALGLVDVHEAAAPQIPLFVPRRYAVVDQLVVADARHRQGVGRALMDAAHQWARARGLTQVELNVYEFNEGARAFYAALGYETLSRKLGRSLEA